MHKYRQPAPPLVIRNPLRYLLMMSGVFAAPQQNRQKIKGFLKASFQKPFVFSLCAGSDFALCHVKSYLYFFFEFLAALGFYPFCDVQG
ncbi:MAG: hypothetical protein J6113_05605, partial [Lachnospiraceae bacterium]|nr:hypothetical protein [Lachnospiraceae bacterium]